VTSWDAAPEISRLHGPILVLGASGFVGANLLRTLLAVRDDVTGTARRLPAWRLEGLPPGRVRVTDLLVEANLDALLDDVRPRTVFNCLAYGAYSFEADADRIYETNLGLTRRLVAKLSGTNLAAYIHAGSSSEYGTNAAAPAEDAWLAPNSEYAVSKAAAAHLLHFHGTQRGFPGANLRLYSVYGPLEDSSRLVPTLVRAGMAASYPPFVAPDISRDLVYVDDVSEAFVKAALAMGPGLHGASINVGTGTRTTMRDLAATARDLFGITGDPAFQMEARAWDVTDWYADPSRARDRIGWEPRTSLRDGLARTREWLASLPDMVAYERSSKRFGLDTRHSVTAVIACYRDGQAIPIMYRRLRETFDALNVDYEIVFVNDCSPDDSEATILAITRDDPRVVGISHARNFGSQAAFRSGMEVATKNACVLLDGDLQDPPEIIAEFVAKWREGYDVIFGRRVKREAPWYMQLAYKAFYRVFDYFSYLAIPHDAGDFALMDRRVVSALLQFPERDMFLRGMRAFAGFRQVGVDYVRPERMFGRSTNNLLRNLGWAKRGIFSFSDAPLNALLFVATLLFGATVLLGAVQVTLRLLFPDLAPPGVTTVLLAILFFGSFNLLAIALVGEYVGRIFTEAKGRPRFIRRAVLRRGEVLLAGEHGSGGASR
jgi:nucleoside-diphosphate-sugar epimerase/glycosyltransferase involved in cell wall biosynthesis